MPVFSSVRSVFSTIGRRQSAEIALGIGSNMGDRRAQLKRAVDVLAQAEKPILSDIRMLPFYNMVITGRTPLSPAALLNELKRLEQRLGRVLRGHWAPREIDLDILAYDEVVMQTPALVIPHASLIERPFALLPLAHLWPNWRYPVPGPLHGVPLRAIAERRYPGPQEEMRNIGMLYP